MPRRTRARTAPVPEPLEHQSEPVTSGHGNRFFPC